MRRAGLGLVAAPSLFRCVSTVGGFLPPRVCTQPQPCYQLVAWGSPICAKLPVAISVVQPRGLGHPWSAYSIVGEQLWGAVIVVDPWSVGTQHMVFHYMPQHLIKNTQFSERNCYKWRCKTMRSKVIEPQGDTRFNVKTPLNARAKNHWHQPASTSTMIGVRLQMPTVVAYKK
jgi:hypothetical protein